MSEMIKPQPAITNPSDPIRSEALGRIVSSIHTGIAYLDQDFRFIWVNQGYARITGVRIDEFPGKTYFEIFPEHDMEATFRRVIDTGGTYSSFNIPGHSPKNPREEAYWDLRLQSLQDADGAPSGLVLILEDVTQRTITEKALQESQTMFEHLFESAPDANILVDEQGRIVALNRQTEVKFGYSRDDLMGKPIEVLIPGRFEKSHLRQRRAYQKSPHLRKMGNDIDLYGQKKDGTEFPVDVTLSPLQTEQGLLVLAVVRDITLRRTAEDALRKSEQRFRSAVENLLEAFAIFSVVRDAQGEVVNFRFEYLNQVAVETFISTGQPVLEQKLTEMLPNTTQLGLLNAFIQVVATGQPFVAKGMEIEDCWGGKLPFTRAFDIQATRLGDGIAVSWRDVTEDRRLEAAMRQQEAMLRIVLDTLPVGVWVVDGQGRVTLGNLAGVQIWGGRLQPDLEGSGGPRAWWRRTGKQIGAQEWPITRAITHGEAMLEEEIDIETPDGQRKTILNSTVPLKDERGEVTGALMVSQQISERKRMEAELSEVQRRLMDGIELERRRLAQDLHDGPMQDLYGVAFQLQGLEELVTNETGAKNIQEARAGVQEVVQALRDFCGDLRPPSLMHFGLKRAILSHIERFHKDHPEVDIHLHLFDDRTELPEPIRLALYRIYQHTISNITRHANAGRIDITFDMIDGKALLEISDDGVGFEVPRRWVKLAREGHLGLIGSQERAESVGGKLEIESAPGKGATIRATVPLPHDNTVTAF